MKLNMSLRKLSALLLIAGSIIALSSCKDEDETATLPYLNGQLTFNIDMFVGPGEKVTIIPKGLEHPEGKKIGYYWKVTPHMQLNDTTRYENGLTIDGRESDGSFEYQFRDSLGTYTITCVAFAEGYNDSSRKTYSTVVKAGLDGSLTGTGIVATDAKITVGEADYYYVSHNGLDWMRNNLANTATGAAYMNSEAMDYIVGRFYSYEEALTACPEGWRLPTDKEWIDLAASINGKDAAKEFSAIPDIAADFMAEVAFNLTEMWPYWPEVGEITNNSSLSFVPVGYANLGEKKDGSYPSASFKGLNEYAAFWTSDKVAGDENMAYYRYLICDQPDMYISKGDVKTFGANVRCVRTSL